MVTETKSIFVCISGTTNILALMGVRIPPDTERISMEVWGNTVDNYTDFSITSDGDVLLVTTDPGCVLTLHIEDVGYFSAALITGERGNLIMPIPFNKEYLKVEYEQDSGLEFRRKLLALKKDYPHLGVETGDYLRS